MQRQMLDAGEQLGRYRLISFPGAGGMGEAFLRKSHRFEAIRKQKEFIFSAIVYFLLIAFFSLPVFAPTDEAFTA